MNERPKYRCIFTSLYRGLFFVVGQFTFFPNRDKIKIVNVTEVSLFAKQTDLQRITKMLYSHKDLKKLLIPLVFEHISRGRRCDHAHGSGHCLYVGIPLHLFFCTI